MIQLGLRMKKTKLHVVMHEQESKKIATNRGAEVHLRLSKIVFHDNDFVGDSNIISHIKNNAELCEIMGPLSYPEVPIAGYVNGVFLSRRIDRLYVNKKAKKIIVLDYKTDIDRNLYYEKYRVQLTEYYELLKQIYPDFSITCKILWLNDFTLENII